MNTDYVVQCVVIKKGIACEMRMGSTHFMVPFPKSHLKQNQVTGLHISEVSRFFVISSCSALNGI